MRRPLVHKMKNLLEGDSMIKILKRFYIKKLLKKLVQTVVLSSVVPSMEIDSRLLPLLEEEVWTAVMSKHLPGMAAEKLATDALFKVLDKRTRALIEDLADLLEDRIEYGKVKCNSCGRKAYSIGDTGFCLQLECYEKEGVKNEGDNSSAVS